MESCANFSVPQIWNLQWLFKFRRCSFNVLNYACPRTWRQFYYFRKTIGYQFNGKFKGTSFLFLCSIIMSGTYWLAFARKDILKRNDFLQQFLPDRKFDTHEDSKRISTYWWRPNILSNNEDKNTYYFSFDPTDRL